MNDAPNQTTLENILFLLNYRWGVETLSQWQGAGSVFEPHRIYEDYEEFLHLDTLARMDAIENPSARTRLKHAFIDHYLQREIMPHENEMRTWTRGVRAIVNDQRIHLRDIIPWCQKSSTREERRILQKETGPLCKFLKPFALNYWEVLLERLEKDLGFDGYLDYCARKKEIDYPFYYDLTGRLLEETTDSYFPAMEKWSRDRFGASLDSLTRFDSINLLGIGQFDDLFPRQDLKTLTRFFENWNIDIENTPGLCLDIGEEPGKSAQAMTFILPVPEEVHVLMRPEGGWIDMETLWHELGHGLSSVFTSPDLSIADRDLPTDFSLSECYAFLLQNLCLSIPFLTDFMGMAPGDARELHYYKVLRDHAAFRRYAAKFISEYEMFSRGDIANGQRYADRMATHTGFYYQPESHLFDLVPEFYCLDYLFGWMGAAIMEDHLAERFGERWMFASETGQLLKEWWRQGPRYDIFRFFKRNGLGALTPDRLLAKWTPMRR